MILAADAEAVCIEYLAPEDVNLPDNLKERIFGMAEAGVVKCGILGSFNKLALVDLVNLFYIQHAVLANSDEAELFGCELNKSESKHIGGCIGYVVIGIAHITTVCVCEVKSFLGVAVFAFLVSKRNTDFVAGCHVVYGAADIIVIFA